MIKTYPEIIKQHKFCCWRWEGKRKVPYNPKTGRRAKSNDPSTFGTMDEALAVVKNYSGIGIGLNGTVGCIDLDHCILSSATGNEVGAGAQQVLDMLPSALVEISPSHTGLHLFFIVPEGFTFDSGAYYTNNRKTGAEVYFAGRFITLTGNIYREGSMAVTRDQLMEFLDAFMRRAKPKALPPGGSILSDAEVLQKLAAESDQKFIRMYHGDWDAPSHSDADAALLMKLAFYCRGDMEQMDRLFRESALMRDKWDRPTGDSTYGIISMRNAVANVSAFYEGRPNAAASDEDEERTGLLLRLRFIAMTS